MNENKLIEEIIECFWEATEEENIKDFFRELRYNKEIGMYPWCLDKKVNQAIEGILEKVLQARHEGREPPKSIILKRKQKIEEKYGIDLNWCCDIRKTMVKKDDFSIMNYGEWRCWIVQAKTFDKCKKCQNFILSANKFYSELWGEVEAEYQKRNKKLAYGIEE